MTDTSTSLPVASSPSPSIPSLPSLEGRRFAANADTVGGEVSAETVFAYHEADGVVWAEYRGGAVVRGYLVGTRTGNVLEFRYAQVNTAHETSSGRCRSVITLTADGRLRLDETWAWESRPGSGTSAVVEI